MHALWEIGKINTSKVAEANAQVAAAANKEPTVAGNVSLWG